MEEARTHVSVNGNHGDPNHQPVHDTTPDPGIPAASDEYSSTVGPNGSRGGFYATDPTVTTVGEPAVAGAC